MSTEQIKVATLLRDAKDAIVKVAQERDAEKERADAAEEKLAAVLTRLEAEKIAQEMHDKGLGRDMELTELIADIEKKAQAGQLPVFKEAVKMAAPNMGARIGQINNDESHGTGTSDFETYIVGGVG